MWMVRRIQELEDPVNHVTPACPIGGIATGQTADSRGDAQVKLCLG